MIPLPFASSCFLQNRNDLRKVLEESDDSLGDVETTKSTTTTTTTPKPPPTTKSKSTTSVKTTKSTTTTSTTHRSTKRYYAPSKSPSDVPKTPKTYFSNSIYNNNNQNNINGQTDYSKSSFKSVTQEAQFDSETPTPAPAKSTINPFYYGFNRLPNKNSNTNNNIINTTVRTISQITTQQKIPRHLLFTSTARTPYSFQFFTTTKKTDLLASSTQSTNSEVDNNYHENQSPPRDDVETEKPKTSTYNPVFDIYFRQIGRQRTTTTGS